ncbi:MAG: redoxin domain-containing protein [Hyphomicrobiales bacterium]
MAVMVGKPAPEVSGDIWVRGAKTPRALKLSEFLGSWVVLFFYPRDFSFLCPTEIAAFAALAQDFGATGAKIVACSTDSFFSHQAFFAQDEKLRDVDFPVFSDTSHSISTAFGVLADDGSAQRGTFIIDPAGIVRHMSVNDLDVGRNVTEVLRVLRALQSGDMCPAHWQPGQEVHAAYNRWLGKVFPRLRKRVLAEVEQTLKTVVFEKGDIIIHQGARPDRFYIIAEGEVSVIRRLGKGKEIELARLGKGDVFGEMGILTGNPRTADVRANTSVLLYALDWKDFKTLIDQSEPTARDFMDIVEQRLKAIPA